MNPENNYSGWILVKSRPNLPGRYRPTKLLVQRQARPGNAEEIALSVPADGRIHELVRLPEDTVGVRWQQPGDDPSGRLAIRPVGWFERIFHMAVRVALTRLSISRDLRAESGLTLRRALFDLPGAYRVALGLVAHHPLSTYPDWARGFDALKEEDIPRIEAHIGRFTARPHFHLLLAADDGGPAAVRATLASLRRQLYRDFTCIVLDCAGALGTGFDPATTDYGTGVQGMADRLASLGGSLEVRSAPGRGTSVRGRLPVGRTAPSDIPVDPGVVPAAGPSRV